MTQAYLYKWTEISSGKWYIGSRTARGCHPDDGYICSSRHVKPLIEANPEDWSRKILRTGAPKQIRYLEYRVLRRAGASKNEMSYNRHNGGADFSTAEVEYDEERRRRIAKSSTGRKRSPEAKRKLADKRHGRDNPFFGKTHTDAIKAKQRERMTAWNTAPKSPQTLGRLQQVWATQTTDHMRTEEARLKHKVAVQKLWDDGIFKREKIAKFGDDNPSRRTDVRKKISEALKGKPSGMLGKKMSEESRKKMAESKRAYWAAKNSVIGQVYL